MSSSPRTILPTGWQRPKGYANGMGARGEMLAIAGQIGWNAEEEIVSDTFVDQFRQALANVVAVTEAAGGKATHLISLTVFVTNKRQYLDAAREIGAVWRELMGKHYPAMALVEVSALVEDRALVEIQGMAILP